MASRPSRPPLAQHPHRAQYHAQQRRPATAGGCKRECARVCAQLATAALLQPARPLACATGGGGGGGGGWVCGGGAPDWLTHTRPQMRRLNLRCLRTGEPAGGRPVRRRPGREQWERGARGALVPVTLTTSGARSSPRGRPVNSGRKWNGHRSRGLASYSALDATPHGRACNVSITTEYKLLVGTSCMTCQGHTCCTRQRMPSVAYRGLGNEAAKGSHGVM